MKQTTVTSNGALAETSNTALAETNRCTHPWEDNALSVLNAEQPVVGPIGQAQWNGVSCNNTPGTSDTSLESGP